MVYCVGLTGTVGSGKSTVLAMFQKLGATIINADTISKKLTQPNTSAYKKILDYFGRDIVLENGDLNRKKIRTLIFADKNKRLWLENLLHPLIREEIQNEVNQARTPYCIIEIPLLLNKDLYPYLSRIILVTSSIEDQIKRLMYRDHSSKEEVLGIINAQPSNQERLNIADDILKNDQDKEHLYALVHTLHLKYLDLAHN